MEVETFKRTVWSHYRCHGRDLPWRRTDDPYRILVSEVMLQQTQVERVIPKYELWLETFPTFARLAEASLGEVVAVWSGLGYNRRAKFLLEVAQRVTREHGGLLPRDPAVLVTLPGIGPNTASSIAAFAFNLPVVFIETNIRSVFIHHFFKDQTGIHDRQLLPLIGQALDKTNPREWYWALMDYGSWLKSQLPNPSRASRHYTKQPPFKGSARELRGQVLKILTDSPAGAEELRQLTGDPRLKEVLSVLEKEGFISRQKRLYRIGA